MRMPRLASKTITVKEPERLDFPPTRLQVHGFADQIREGPMPLWQAYAYSRPPCEHKRDYVIEARSERDAAVEACRRLIEEVECLDGEV